MIEIATLEAQTTDIIELIQSRDDKHGPIAARPLSYISAGTYLKADRLSDTAVKIINASVHGEPANPFLTPSQIDTLQDTVAYCLEMLRRNQQLVYNQQEGATKF